MATITRFEDIEAWQLGRALRQEIYRCSKSFEFAKDYPLRDQTRRAAISVTANIAEGFERDGSREFLQLLSTSKASCAEIQDHFYTVLDEAYVNEHQFENLYPRAADIARKIGSFMNYLRQTELRGRKFETSKLANFKHETRNPKPETRNS